MTIPSKIALGGLVGAATGFVLPYTESIIRALPLTVMALGNVRRASWQLASYMSSATLSPYAIPLAIAGGIIGAGVTYAMTRVGPQASRPHVA